MDWNLRRYFQIITFYLSVNNIAGILNQNDWSVNVENVVTDPIDLNFLRININNPDGSLLVRLKLMKTEGFLATKNTPVISITGEYGADAQKYEQLQFFRDRKVMETIGNFTFYHDYSQKAAAVLFTNKTGSYLSGIVGHYLRLDDFPMKYVDKELDKQKLQTDKKIKKKAKKYSSEAVSVPYDNVFYPEIVIITSYATIQQVRRYEAVKNFLVYWNAVDMLMSQIPSPKIRINIAGILIPTANNVLPFMDNDPDDEFLDFSDSIEEIESFFFHNHNKIRLNYDLIFGMTTGKLCVPPSQVQPIMNCINGISPALPDTVNKINYDFESVDTVALIHYENDISTYANLVQKLGFMFAGEYIGRRQLRKCTGIMEEYHRHGKTPLKWSMCTLKKFQKYFTSPRAEGMKNYPHYLSHSLVNQPPFVYDSSAVEYPEYSHQNSLEPLEPSKNIGNRMLNHSNSNPHDALSSQHTAPIDENFGNLEKPMVKAKSTLDSLSKPKHNYNMENLDDFDNSMEQNKLPNSIVKPPIQFEDYNEPPHLPSAPNSADNSDFSEQNSPPKMLNIPEPPSFATSQDEIPDDHLGHLNQEIPEKTSPQSSELPLPPSFPINPDDDLNIKHHMESPMSEDTDHGIEKQPDSWELPAVSPISEPRSFDISNGDLFTNVEQQLNKYPSMTLTKPKVLPQIPSTTNLPYENKVNPTSILSSGEEPYLIPNEDNSATEMPYTTRILDHLPTSEKEIPEINTISATSQSSLDQPMTPEKREPEVTSYKGNSIPEMMSSPSVVDVPSSENAHSIESLKNPLDLPIEPKENNVKQKVTPSDISLPIHVDTGADILENVQDDSSRKLTLSAIVMNNNGTRKNEDNPFPLHSDQEIAHVDEELQKVNISKSGINKNDENHILYDNPIVHENNPYELRPGQVITPAYDELPIVNLSSIDQNELDRIFGKASTVNESNPYELRPGQVITPAYDELPIVNLSSIDQNELDRIFGKASTVNESNPYELRPDQGIIPASDELYITDQQDYGKVQNPTPIITPNFETKDLPLGNFSNLDKDQNFVNGTLDENLTVSEVDPHVGKVVAPEYDPDIWPPEPHFKNETNRLKRGQRDDEYRESLTDDKLNTLLQHERLRSTTFDPVQYEKDLINSNNDKTWDFPMNDHETLAASVEPNKQVGESITPAKLSIKLEVNVTENGKVTKIIDLPYDSDNSNNNEILVVYAKNNG